MLDRSLDGMSASKHLRILKATPTVTTKTLKNVLAGRLITPMSDSREQLLSQYVTAIHGKCPENDTDLKQQSAEATGTKAVKRPVVSENPGVAAAAAGKAAKKPKISKESLPLTEGEVIDLDRQKFKVGKLAAYGAMASLFFGKCLEGKHAGKQVMLKLQPREKRTIYQITTEHHVLTKLKQQNNGKLLMQEALAYGSHKDHRGESYVLVTGLLGADLLKLGGEAGTHSVRNVMVLAQQALVLFEQLHAANFLHRDIKPENLVLGCAGTAGARKLHLIDFGTSESLVDRNGARRTAPQAVEGSIPYMAVTVHQKQPLGKRDDIESLVWTLLRLCLGKLPWEYGKVSPTAMVQHKLRVSTQGVKLDPACKLLPPYMAKCFDAMLAHVRALDTPEAEPDYPMLRKCVETAWKSAAFSPTSVAKAELDY